MADTEGPFWILDIKATKFFSGFTGGKQKAKSGLWLEYG
jgi:hypothetical protein